MIELNGIRIEPSACDAVLFKVKKFQYNTYKIEHSHVNGTLCIASIPTGVRKIPQNILRQTNVPVPEESKYMVSYQSIVSFVSSGGKIKDAKPWKIEYAKSERRDELFDYIVKEQISEPWNEYVISESSPALLRTKTTLANAYTYVGFADGAGDPVINVQHSTTLSVSTGANVEHGMT